MKTLKKLQRGGEKESVPQLAVSPRESTEVHA